MISTRTIIGVRYIEVSRLLPTDELDEVMPKDDVVVTKQAKKKIKTLRLGMPIKSCSLTTEDLRLASFFFVEAWVLSNDSNTATSGSSPGYILHRLRN